MSSWSPFGWRGVARRHHRSPTVAMRPTGQDPELLLAPGTVAVPLRSQPNASPFWIMLLLVSGRLDNGMIRIWQPDTGVAKMPSTDPTPSVTADQLTRALGEAVISDMEQFASRRATSFISGGGDVPG